MKCQRVGGTREDCGDKATVFVMAHGGRAWSGYYCDNCGPWIIKRRMRMIRKDKQNVVLRPITAWDKKQYKERVKRRAKRK